VIDRRRLFCSSLFDVFGFFRFFRRPLYKELLRKKDGVDFFDLSAKMSWGRCFGKAFWPVQGGPEGSGSRLRRSWVSPRRSGGRLGKVLGALGAFWETPLSQSDFGSIFIDFERHKGAKRDAFGDPKWVSARKSAFISF